MSLKKAIKIDGGEPIVDDSHIDAMRAWQEREGLTDEQVDAAFEAGRIEFGRLEYRRTDAGWVEEYVTVARAYDSIESMYS